MARLCKMLLGFLMTVALASAATDHAQGSNTVREPTRSSRKMLQYTGTVVAGATPMQGAGSYATPAAVSSYPAAAYPANPAVGVMNDAMATGQAPSDIASIRARGWVRGRVMGQNVNADGVATANVGNNAYGGITAVGDAYGQFETSGRYGYAAGQGQARAAAATTLESAANGYTVMNGAAAAQASGQIYGSMPSGGDFYARGSARAEAEGTIMYAT